MLKIKRTDVERIQFEGLQQFLPSLYFQQHFTCAKGLHSNKCYSRNEHILQQTHSLQTKTDMLFYDPLVT